MANHQKRLQVLRQQLDDSIKLYYCRQQQQVAMNRSSNGGRSVVAPVSVKNRRILHMLHQDETVACIQISGNMASKTFSETIVAKVPNNNSNAFEKVVKSAVSPLQVIVNSSNHQQQHSASETTINFMAGFNSPVGSIDSGMSSLSSSNSSPASSPGCSPILVSSTPFQYVVEQQVVVSRGRSTSESVSATVGLKSILKKSIPSYISAGRFLRFLSFFKL
uniref:Uncharacterized protein n=1 Tax=Elaeophora elaphi TaxID=1147741 RepID=A0A0R3S702_9BILA